MYRRRFRSRRRRSTWGYANEDLLQASGATPVSYVWLLPPGRVNFLADTDRVPAIGFTGCHLWLDFNWINTGTASALPDVTLYAIVSQQEPNSETPTEIDNIPWGAPSLPSAITTWDQHDEDGTESFLWVHHIKGQSPPNALVSLGSSVGMDGPFQNQYDAISPGSEGSPAIVCRKFFVAAEWQPDVIIKTRRRVWKDEGIALVMRADTPPGGGITASLAVRYRTLVSRGR